LEADVNRDKAPIRRGVVRSLAAAACVLLAAALAGPAAGASDDANRAAARAEAQHLIDETPLPAGAVPQDTSPAPVLDHSTQGGPLDQDTTLDRVAWWTVPVSPSDYATYLAANAPADLTRSGSAYGTVTDGHAGTSVSWTEQDFSGTDTKAYTTPELWLTWTAYDGGTAVRSEVYIGARWPRAADSYVTGPIHRVDVRIHQASDPVTGAGKRLSASYTARGKVRRLRAAFNGLLGDLHNEGAGLIMSCPDIRLTTTTVVFHLLHGHVVRVRELAGCVASMQVWRDGRRVSPPLDPSGFAERVAAIAK